MTASKCVRCMQCLCWGFVLGRRGQLSRRSAAGQNSSNHIYRSMSELSWCCIWGSSAWGIGSVYLKLIRLGGGGRGVGAFCAGLERSTQLFIMNLACK